MSAKRSVRLFTLAAAPLLLVPSSSTALLPSTPQRACQPATPGCGPLTIAQLLGPRTTLLRGTLTQARAAAGSPERSAAPYFRAPETEQAGVDGLPLKRTFADVDVAGVIAQVKLTQVYRNEGDTTLEAVYVFPGSTRAAVYAMKMRIGDRVIEADIREREQARQDYQKAKREGRTASLLEQQRPNVFQMSVANIHPGDEIEVNLFYTELLVPEERIYELVIPTVVGPRYVNGSEEDPPGGHGWTANPHLPQGQQAPYTFGAHVDLRAGLPVSKVQCSHDVATRFGGHDATLELDEDAAHGNRDLIVRYMLAGDQVQSGVLLYPGEDEKFFLVMLEPPRRVEPRHLVPREYIFILDVSGSMSGFPLEVSKRLMHGLLDQLGPQDYFNVLFFAGDSALLSPASLPVSRANLQKARDLVDMQRGGGGTELVPALERALALPRPDADVSRVVVIATDGYVGVEKNAFSLIREKLGDASFFPFGIGSSVNRFLIEGMARAGQGEPFVVTDAVEAEDAAKRFERYIASPVLTNVEARFEGIDTYDVEPQALPDLFAERPVLLFGKYRGKPTGSVTVTGAAADGPFEATLRLAEADRSEENAALRALWARQRVQRLSDDAGLQQGKQARKQITALGLKYSILTEYTSFVAIDTEVRAGGERSVTVRQPLPLPAGVSNAAVGGLVGSQVGTSYGFGGLGLSGSGKGGGGSAGSSFGIGPMGTRGRGGGSAGYGSGVGALRGRSVSPVRVMPGKVVVKGSLSKEEIQRVITRHHAAVRYCYERELQRDPSLAGRVVVELTIGEDGRVTKARIKSSTLNNAAVEACIVHRMRTLRFHAPAGSGTVIVNYPFVFSSK